MVGFESVVKRVGRMDFDSGGDGSKLAMKRCGSDGQSVND